jgi:hypothetical protein
MFFEWRFRISETTKPQGSFLDNLVAQIARNRARDDPMWMRFELL